MSNIISVNGNFCWVRQIEVRLYSKLYNVKPLILGGSDSNQLNIEVKGEKKLSSLEDNGTVSISNLTYATITRIMLGQYYKIEIWAGYRTQALNCYFKGEIAYISNKINMRKDYTCYILFASEMVASYSQSRINFTLNSGINLYAAFNYMLLTKGISTSHLSESLKNQFLNEVTTYYGTPASLSDLLANQTSTFSIDTDSSIDGSIINCNTLQDKRQIRINPSTINFTKGNPQLTKDGLSMSLLPTFCFKPGDIIIIDNSIIDVSESALSGAQSNFKSNYLDKNGAYMIRSLSYTFQNRGANFSIDILARSVDIIAQTLGVNY